MKIKATLQVTRYLIKAIWLLTLSRKASFFRYLASSSKYSVEGITDIYKKSGNSRIRTYWASQD